MSEYLIVGLGNPGKEYKHSKHNAGYRVLELLAEEKGLTWIKKYRGWHSSFVLENRVFEIIKPGTYMNLSGLSLSSYIKANNSNPLELAKKLIVIHDDLDLPLGVIRFKFGSSSGGQKGVESIINTLGTKAFHRLKIGINRPSQGLNSEDYVLLPFTGDNELIFAEVLEKSVLAIKCFLDNGIKYAQSLYN